MIVLGLSTCALTFAQRLLPQRTLGLKDGLSQTQINHLLQDRQGFLWISTNDGLNRYDGYQFRVFRSDPGNPHALSYNVIAQVLEDTNGRLWVASNGGGLHLFDPKDESFTRIPGLADPNVETLFQDSSGFIWVGMNHGHLQLLDPNNLSLKTFEPRLEGWDEKQHQINAIHQDRSGRIWVASNWGLYGSDTYLGPLKPVPVDPSDPTRLDNTFVASLSERADGSLWVGTGYGLQLLDPISMRVRRYDLGPEHKRSYDPVYDILEREDWLWISRNSGLYRIKKDRDPSLAQPGDRISDSSKFSTALLADRTGLIWVGMGGQGLVAFDPKRPFNYLGPRSGQVLLDSLFAYAMLEAQDGNIWIGHTEGLHIWDPRAQRMSSPRQPRPQSAESPNVWALLQTVDNQIWVGTDINLYAYDGSQWTSAQSHVKHMDYPYISLCESFAFPRPSLWVGTLAGLQLIDATNHSLKRLETHQPDRNSLPHNAVRALLESNGPRGRVLWVGTEGGGLARYDPYASTFKNYAARPGESNSLSDNRVISLFQQDQNLLWIGTRGGGLNRFNLIEERFTHFRMAHGLANDTVYAILPDLKGNLWLSTNRGISRFNPEQLHFKNFTAEEGLQGNEFNTGAGFRSRDGTLYFGGTNGLSYFQPESILDNPLPPPLALTRFQLFDKTLEVSDERSFSPLLQAINQTQDLTLNSDQNVFSIEFAALDFNAPQQNRYRYQLEGFDLEALETDAGNRIATYTNLDPGRYRFRVWGSNSDRVWNEQGLELRIRVQPPAWKSGWAFLLYAVLCLSIVLAYLTWQKRIRNRLEKIVAHRTSELSKKNLELDAGYRELITLDHIIQTINAEVELQDVAVTLLEQGHALFADFYGSLFLLRESEDRLYQIIAATGTWRETTPQPLRHDQVLELFGAKIDDASQGIHIFSPFHGLGGSYPTLALLKTFHDDRLRGLVIFASQRDSFNDGERLKLERFRQHMVVAVTRARILEDLLRAQQDLVATAHSAGMADNAASVLHDFGNAFNGIQTNIQLIDAALKNDTWPEQLTRLAGVIERMADGDAPADAKRLHMAASFTERMAHGLSADTQRLSQWINEAQTSLSRLMHLMRKQQGQTKSTGLVYETNLNHLVQEVIDGEHLRWRHSNIAITQQFSLLPALQLDRPKVRMALLCVLENAYEAIRNASADSPPGVIHIRSYTERQYVVLEVHDNGAGIDPSQRELVFRQGYTTKQNGCGLGLHFAANTLNELGGTIEIAPGSGAHVTCIRFLFPSSRNAPN